MRTPVIAANWKMHKTIREAVAFIDAFRDLVEGIDDVEIVVAPPFTAVHAVAAAASDSRIQVAGQDLYWESHGAFTGQISAGMLVEAGATHVIIGHSERRHVFGELDAEVGSKVRAAIAAGLTPVACVGETLDERDAGQTTAVLTRQLEGGVEGLTGDQVGALIVAYEPVWAIGTGRTASPEQAQEAHAHLRDEIRRLAGPGAAGRCRVLYGGSVKPGNVEELTSQPDVDGALVGGASLDLERFAQIVAGGRPSPV
jgi:triosephosphate isomerase